MADLPITSDEGATPVVINDPTTTANVANVKAASTASVAGDSSLVVALSPNSPLPTGTNNIGVTGVAQGSTTSGEHGDLIQGAVTTAAPAYTTAQTSPLSLTTAGALRTDSSATTQPISGTVAVTQSTSPWVISGAVTNTPPANQSVNLTQLNSVALGSPSNYGTSPGAVEVQGVNAFITNTVPVTLASTTITGTVAVTQSTSPWVVSLASTTITGTVTTAGNLTNNNAAPIGDNLGVLPALAEGTLSASRYTTGDQVLLVTDLAGNTNVDLQYYLGAAVSKTNPIATTISDGTNVITAAISAYGTAPTGTEVMGVNAFITNTPAVTGNKTNNNAAPGATNLGVLPALANAASPTWTEGDLVLESVDLTGRQRIRGTLSGNSAAPDTDGIMTLTAVAAAAAPTWTSGDLVLLSEDLSGNLRVKDTSAGPVTPGTVATNSELAGGQYNSTLPTLTTGQQGALQTDSSGRLLVNAQQTGLSSVITTGSLSTVGTTAVQMHSGSILALTGVTVRSSPSNTAMIYVGPSTVTANTAAATDGIPLKIGESITLAITNINLIYLIATAAAQEVFWVVL
jgi:hypothetical protein